MQIYKYLRSTFTGQMRYKFIIQKIFYNFSYLIFSFYPYIKIEVYCQLKSWRKNKLEKRMSKKPTETPCFGSQVTLLQLKISSLAMYLERYILTLCLIYFHSRRFHTIYFFLSCLLICPINIFHLFFFFLYCPITYQLQEFFTKKIFSSTYQRF